MRVVLLFGVLVTLSACAGGPQALGITGPGQQPVPAAPTAPPGGDSTVVPGVPTSGSFYGPTQTPTTGSSGFWGYN